MSLRDSLSGGSRSDDDDFDDIHCVEAGKKKHRERTWSGTFRRFPTGGIKPAAIQKKGAVSSDYLSTSSSGAHSSSKSHLKSVNDSTTVHDDYSFSVIGGDYNVGGDYGLSPRTPNRRSGTAAKGSPTAGGSPSGREEFSLPETYDDSIHSREEASLYSKWSVPHGRQMPTRDTFTSPLPSPRRVNPSDLDSSPHHDDESRAGWSMDSYGFSIQSPSARQLYRDYTTGDQSTPASTPRGKAGLHIPKFA
jgi:hypothetical protein